MKLTDEQREDIRQDVERVQRFGNNKYNLDEANEYIDSLNRLKKSVPRLLSSEQAWKEEAERLESANRRYAEVGADKIEEVDNLQAQLNQAVEVIEELTLDDTSEKAQRANRFLSSLSQEGEKGTAECEMATNMKGQRCKHLIRWPHECRDCIEENGGWTVDWMDGMTNKFCGIFKHEDAVKYLNDKDKADFNYLCNKIEKGRERDGKRPVNAYLVINIDEPYAEEVAAILKRHGQWG